MNYHKRNFKSIGNLIEPLVKRHGQLNIISYAKLLDIWDTIVGEEISKKAHPIKMKTIKGGEKYSLSWYDWSLYGRIVFTATRHHGENKLFLFKRSDSSDKIATIT